ncbi:MAG: C25 family cysteine peptidase [Prevotellaceae bacterium]|jgi:gingipain R|nr:C25 family cysteine peptidase [Prevotellaceae bacterium]
MKSKVLLLGIFVTHTYCLLGQSLSTEKDSYLKVLSTTSEGITIDININDFDRNSELIDEKEYYKISLKQESFILEKGYPELPKIVRDISIPPTSGITGKVIKSEYKDVQLPIIPSKGVLLRNINPKDVPYIFDEAYSQNKFYPENRFDFGEPYLMRNVRGNTVSIYPFAYNPVTQTLRIYTKLTIEISFEGMNNKNTLTRISEDRNQYFEPVFRNHFINYVTQSNYGGSTENTRSVTDNGKMLIITYDNFYNDILNYATHKNSIGIPTQVVKMSNIGTTSANILNYIQNSYNNDNTLTFVLLVGDHTQVPSMLVGSAGSDPSYSLIVGSDNYPDIIVGRFSAETNAQLATMISRSIAYDNMTEQSWFHQGIGIASSEGPGHNNEYDYQHIRNIRNTLLNYHYTSVDELYDESQGGQDATGNPTAAMVSTAVNNGVSIINYTGHGDYDRWVTSNFTNANVSALTNNDKLPFVFSVACQNGNFTGYTCFAETWLRANNSTGNPIGAAAFYGSSVNQAWIPPMYAQDDFISLLTSNSNTTFGTLCYNACLGMISSYGVQEFRHWHIFGDPSLKVIPHRNCPPVINYTNQIVTTNTTVTNCRDINVQNVNVTSAAKLTLDAAGTTTVESDFEVTLGSELEIK